MSPQPAVLEGDRSTALGEDLAITFRLPEAYHGVIVQRDRGRKTFTLTADFMDNSFEPVEFRPSPRYSVEVVACRSEEHTGFASSQGDP